MIKTDNSQTFIPLTNKVTNPNSKNPTVELHCIYEIASGPLYIEVRIDPRPSFSIYSINADSDSANGPRSHYRRSKNGTWRLKLKEGEGPCVVKQMSNSEYIGLIGGIRSSIAQIREVKCRLIASNPDW